MRAKVILAASLVANAALVFLLAGRFRSAPVRPVEPASQGPVVLSNYPIRFAKTNIILNARTLTWQDLESTNYELYVLNLRGIGCPESTVRDIIVADVNQLFARRRRELNVTTNDPPWWRSEGDTNEMRALLDKAQTLEDERKKLLTRLLGAKWEEAPDAVPDPLPLAGPTLSLLTAEQKQAVQDIVARSRQAIQDYTKAREKEGSAPSQAELAQFRENTRRELEQKLSPQQLEEFLLRYSSNANQLRNELRGFNSAPEEFRKLFAATDPIDRALQLLPEDEDPATVKQRQALEQQRDAAIQQALTPERYDAYRAAKDPDYQLALNEAQEAGAKPGAGRRLYELNQVVALERERIHNDNTLTPAQRDEELAEVDKQREATRAELLNLPPPADSRPKAPPPQWQHAAVPGETLAGLSLQYRVPLSEIIKANPGLEVGDPLPPGQSIRIPPRQTPLPPPTPAFVPPFGKAGEGPR